MSMEEEEARRAAAAGASAVAASGPAVAPPSASAVAVPGSSAAATVEPSTAAVGPDAMDDEEAMLQQALAMSEGRDVEMQEHTTGNEEEMTEEEAIARAIEMSMKGDNEENQGK